MHVESTVKTKDLLHIQTEPGYFVVGDLTEMNVLKTLCVKYTPQIVMLCAAEVQDYNQFCFAYHATVMWVAYIN